MEILNKTGSKLSREGKYLLKDIEHRIGLYNNSYNEACGNRVIIYHGICKDGHTRFNPIFLTQKMFEQHLKLYKKHSADIDTF
jgi:hypothetical protein